MKFSSKLTKAASQVPNRSFMALCTLLVVLFAVETVLARDMQFTGPHTAIRRLDCSVFCRKTGFNGVVGGCQCGFTLFASKRSSLLPSRIYQSPTVKEIYPESNFLGYEESVEDGEMSRMGNSKDRQAAAR